MSSRIVAIVRKEFLQIRHDRRTLAMVLLLPIMQLVLFGYAINTVVDHLPTVVLDESRDADSRALVSALNTSGYFDVVCVTPPDTTNAISSALSVASGFTFRAG